MSNAVVLNPLERGVREAGLSQHVLLAVAVLTVLVAAAALASIATLYGALLTNTSAREMLAPVLMLPVTMPVLIGGVAATLDSLSATAVPTRLPWLGLVLAYCAILLSLAVLLVDYIFED